jgi:hypothetical protein
MFSLMGFSLLSTSFIICLLTGAALYHPVLGPLPQLIAYSQAIVVSSLVLALANQLSPMSTPKKVYIAPRRRKSYSV